MNQRVEFQVHGLSGPVREELPPGHGVLLGREPSACSATDGVVMRSERLESEAVSRQHLRVVVRHDRRIHVQDLHSTNETWILLRSGQTVVVETAGEPLRIGVAMGGASLHVRTDPAEPKWNRRGEYAGAVCDSVRAWMAELGLSLRVEVAPIAPLSASPGTTWLPLREGVGIRLVHDRSTAQLDASVLQRLHAFVARQNEIRDLRAQAEGDGVVLESPAMQEAWRDVVVAARAGIRLIITGPTGAGKSVLARCYHDAWNPGGPFVHLNCSQYGGDPNLSHALIFGARRGVATGVPREGMHGLVEQAGGGTLFLDEVAELHADIQKNLLVFLDEGSYTPLGGVTRQVRVRLVCATNKDLRREVREGRFREDLWHRLRGAEVAVPSLRERAEDVRAFLTNMRDEFAPNVVQGLTASAWEALLAQPWRGGFREVRNVVQQLYLAQQRLRLREIGREMCLDAIRRTVIDEAEVVTNAGAPRATPPTGATEAATRERGDVSERWRAVVHESFTRFVERDEGVLHASVLARFIEHCLKPVFMAHACGLAGRDEVPRGARYQDLGEAVGFDRTTVKAHLARYVEGRRGA